MVPLYYSWKKFLLLNLQRFSLDKNGLLHPCHLWFHVRSFQIFYLLRKIVTFFIIQKENLVKFSSRWIFFFFFWENCIGGKKLIWFMRKILFFLCKYRWIDSQKDKLHLFTVYPVIGLCLIDEIDCKRNLHRWKTWCLLRMY